MEIRNAANIFYTSMATVRSDATIAWYRKKIDSFVNFFPDREIESIDLYDLESFRESLNRNSHAPGRNGKVSVYTVHGYIRALKSFFSFLQKRKILSSNPAEELEKPRLPKQQRKGVSPEAAEKMINASMINPRDYAILLFVRDTGCRAGGIYNLLTSNLDLKHNKALIREKGEKERMVFFTPETTWALAMYISVRNNPYELDNFFLNDNTHRPLTYTGVYQIFKRLAKITKVNTKFSPHQWRHATIRSWLKAGMNLKSASEIAGHTTEKVTGDIYGTLDELELQMIYNEIMERLKK